MLNVTHKSSTNVGYEVFLNRVQDALGKDSAGDVFNLLVDVERKTFELRIESIPHYFAMWKYDATVPAIVQCDDFMFYVASGGENHLPVEPEIELQTENSIVRSRVQMPNGKYLSIQASKFHSCYPKQNYKSLNDYETYEIMFDRVTEIPFHEFPDLEQFQSENNLCTFNYVPRMMVERLFFRWGDWE